MFSVWLRTGSNPPDLNRFWSRTGNINPQVDNGQFLGRYFLGRLYKPESQHEELLRMSPSERYLAVTVGPDSNSAIQALYNALTGELLIQ